MTGYNHRGPSPFYRRPADMPAILCGPILRRVTRSSVSVFLALKGEASVALRLHDRPDSGSAKIAESELKQSVPLGRHLHLVVVTVTMGAGQRLETGHRYGYDLVFDSASLQLDDVALSGAYETMLGVAAGTFADGGAITYGNDTLPGFVLPAKEAKDLRFLHGSCRKPHGQGTDMLATVDDHLRVTHDKPAERPQLLLLTGDQIYADDVSPILLRCLNDSLPVVLGWRETIPSPHLSLPFGITLPPWLVPELLSVDELQSDGTWLHTDQPDKPLWDTSNADLAVRTDPQRASRIAPPRRGEEVTRNGGLSSDEANAHLIFLGEYLLMYMFCWSDTLWPRDESSGSFRLPDYNEAVPSFSLFGAYSQHTLTEQRRQMEAFAGGLKKVRRALANISTLMIFDDHEVTDDWNLNADWVKRVNASVMGSRILRNALVAYALFQDWGSQPEDYAPGKNGAAILSAVTYSGSLAEGPPWEPNRPAPTPEPAPSLIATSPDALNALLALGSNALRSVFPSLVPTEDDPGFAIPEKVWSHVVQPHGDDTGYRIIFLDSRTRRGFPSQTLIDQATSTLKTLIGDAQPAAGLVMSAALLSEDAFRSQLEDQIDPDRLNIVVAPAPVFGVAVVEHLAQPVNVAAVNPENADSETWSGHPRTFMGFVDLLKRKGSGGVVLLSGDVHYGFSHKVTFKTSLSDWASHAVVQLCASSLKNQTLGTVFAGVTSPEPSQVLPFTQQRINEVLLRLDTMTAEKINLFGLSDGPGVEDAWALWGYAKHDWWDNTPAWWDPAQLALKIRDLNPLALPGKFLLPMTFVFRAGVLIGIYQWLEQDFSPVKAAYGVESLKDARADNDRKSNIIVADSSGAAQAALRYSEGEAKQIVGYNNLGGVAFTEESGVKGVSHQLYWPPHDNVQTTYPGLVSSQHNAKLKKE